MVVSQSFVEKTSVDFYSPNICRLIFNSGSTQLSSQIHTFIQDNLDYFDRFIFVYHKSHPSIIEPFFSGNLIRGSVIAKKSVFFSLLYPNIRETTTNNDSHIGRFDFFEHYERFIVLWALTYDEVFEIMGKFDLGQPSTCIILFNLDQLCYHTSSLLNFHTSLLPYLSRWCGYLFITVNVQALSFYQWLASKLDRILDTQDFIKIQDYENSFDNWEFLTIGETPLELKGLAFPDSIWKEIDATWQEIPELRILVTDVPLAEKLASVHVLNSKKLSKPIWFKLWRFVLALLIAIRISYKEKLIIITNSFEKESWENFRAEYSYPVYEKKFNPEFIGLDEIYTLDESILGKCDRILLDLGDELTPWLSQPFIIQFIEKTSFLKQVLKSMPVTFYHPFLLSEDYIERLLATPSIPMHIIKISDLENRHRELLFTTMLLVALKRQNKDFFYSKISSYWSQKLIDERLYQALANLIKLLRFSGLMDRLHFKTSPLGEFFLQNNLSISDFLEHLQSYLPSLFEWKLTDNLSEELFYSYYISCAKWFFQVTKYHNFSAQYLRIFLKTLSYSFHRYSAEVSFQDDVIETLTELIRQEGDLHPRLTSFFRKKTKKFEKMILNMPRPISAPKRHWGRALKQVLTDIGSWVRSLETSQQMIPEKPFFPIRKKARLAVRENKDIEESSYVRAVQRVMRAPLLNRSLSIFSDKKERKAIKNLCYFFRKNLALKNVKLKNNKSSHILTFKNIDCLRKRNPNALSFEYLSYSCRSCIYFEQRRKKDCILYNRVYFINKERIPKAARGREHTIFSNLVGCPLWRPRYQALVVISEEEVFKCVHCNRPLLFVPSYPQDEITCSCESVYQFVLKKNNSIIYEYQLTLKHTINHELQLLFPGIRFKAKIRGIHDIQIPPTRQYDYMKHDLPSLRKTKDKYLFIRQSDRLDYDKDKQQLGVFDINGYGQFYDLQDIQLIDSQKKDIQFFNILKDIPTSDFNIRSSCITISQNDRASIIYNKYSPPVLHVKKERKKYSENYPFNNLISVYNVGKPRLCQTLQEWGVEQIYYSSKGISKKPTKELKEAINLKGVRTVLSDIHLLGLVLSAINATANLIGEMRSNGYDNLGDQLFTRMKKLLFRSPTRLYHFYYDFNPYSNLNRAALEAWIYRPFAEGMRELVSMIQDKDYPMISLSYGRTVARLVWKRGKSGLEFLGGYTPFDAALNALNRSIRYQLRIWNAKTGFGFKTFPLFSHQPKDKPGRAGHLDLEEPGRIITRFVLLDNILSGELKGNHFNPQFDDDHLIYYTPSVWIQAKLRFQLVKQQIFPFQLYYNHQWMAYKDAHKQHVQHLRWCLESCFDLKTISSRKEFLLNNYQPLIYNIKIIKNDVKEIWDELIFLFIHCWQNWTQKSFLRKKKYPTATIPILINQKLIERIISWF